jgi:predicted MFS family arabinose efflux permease
MRVGSKAGRLPGDPGVRRALGAFGLAAFTEFATWLAILLVAYREGGPVLVGVAMIVMLVPAIVLIPVAAGIGDRMPRSRALALTHGAVAATSALTGLLLLLEAPFWAVLTCAALLNSAVGLVRPMHFAALPLLAKKPGDVVAANGVSSSLDGLAAFVGFLSAGVLTDYLGAWTVLMLCALLSLGAALLTGGLRTPVAPVDPGDVTGRIQAALGGFGALRRNPGAIALLLLIPAMSLVAGANDILTVTFNDQVLESTESTAGLIAGAYGIGLAIGGAALASLAGRPRLAPVVLAGALLMGTAQAAVSLLGALWPTAVLLMLVGVGVSMILVSGRTLLQRSTDDAVLARVMGVQEGVYLVGLTAGALVGPLLVSLMGASRAFLPLGALVALFGVLSYAAIRRLDAQAVLRRQEVDLLRGVPFLEALLPYELERLAQRARWVEAPAGTSVITQGEPGDSYYVVAAGRLSVTVDGVLRDHEMTAGDGFGEIALLNQIPRTATVQALEHSRMLTISAEDFLGTVLPNEQGVRLAHTIAEARRRADDEDRGPATADA